MQVCFFIILALLQILARWQIKTGIDQSNHNITVQQSLDNLSDPLTIPGYLRKSGEQPWSLRRLRVAEHLLGEQVYDLAELFGEDWDWVGVGRDDGVEAGEYSPVFYKKDVDSGMGKVPLCRCKCRKLPLQLVKLPLYCFALPLTAATRTSLGIQLPRKPAAVRCAIIVAADCRMLKVRPAAVLLRLGAATAHGCLSSAVSEFILHSYDSFWTSNTSFTPSRFPGAGSHRVCTTIRLQRRNGGHEFVVLNTHMDDQSEAQRRHAASMIFARARYEAVTIGCPAFVMGDFNSPPDGRDSGAYEITTGVRQPGALPGDFAAKFSVDPSSPPFVLHDLRAHTPRRAVSANHATFTGFTAPNDTRVWSRIDFLFGGGKWRVSAGNRPATKSAVRVQTTAYSQATTAPSLPICVSEVNRILA
ncbi:Endo/exonuclease/phosphatase domain-containing protein [Mycena venus]|uniref:Endo/exonuclease/phosphatase domain-containing protein n=1 Tax=Mycena venus TaxID=2733690 RepID=A0A8H6XY40_9AGAR|nr:Endo/exonuclease/phosphatase domain-containing protein [Mycena venus]